MSDFEGGDGAAGAAETTDGSGTGAVEQHEVHDGEDGVATGDPREGAPAPRRVVVKIDGQDLEVDEDELKRGYQTTRAANSRFQEAARLAKEAQAQVDQVRQLAEAGKKNPLAIFEALGVDVHQFAEQLMFKKLEEELLSPEEKELRELRTLKKKLDEDAEVTRQQKTQDEAAALAEQAGAEIESEISGALEASGLKATPRTVARVAEMIMASLDEKGTRLSASDALKRLQVEYRGERTEHIQALDPAELKRDFPAQYEAILNHAAAEAHAPVPTLKSGVGRRPATETTRKGKSIDDWLAD